MLDIQYYIISDQNYLRTPSSNLKKTFESGLLFLRETYPFLQLCV